MHRSQDAKPNQQASEFPGLFTFSHLKTWLSLIRIHSFDIFVELIFVRFITIQVISL
ncbi:hypothetical protein THOD04_80214 [Vibrio owensii]|nr:hypothetical protein THZB04_80213 [Vibrio owensii]CAH1600365.1 hypothetical protein THOD04_80214 [Vibrio owensii]